MLSYGNNLLDRRENVWGGGGNVGVGDVREGENVGRQLTLLNLLEL